MFSPKKNMFLPKHIFSPKKHMFSPKRIDQMGKNQQSKQKKGHGFDLWSWFFFSFSIFSCFFQFLPIFPFFIRLILQIQIQEFGTDCLGLVYLIYHAIFVKKKMSRCLRAFFGKFLRKCTVK